jgi:hypothetical protein
MLKSGDRGGAILLVILLGGSLSAIGLGLAALASAERALSGNYYAGTELLYAAEAIADRAVRDLSASSAWAGALLGTEPSTFLDATSYPVMPWGEVLDLAAETGALQTSVAPTAGTVWRLYASGTFSNLTSMRSVFPAYVIAWVADDQADQDGESTADSNGFIVIRTEARATGRLKRAVEVVLRNVPPTAEPPPPGPAEVPGVRVVSWREIR